MPNNTYEQAVNVLKSRALAIVDEFKQEGRFENEKLFEDAKDKIKEVYESLKNALKELSDKEEIKTAFEKANNTVQDVLNMTRLKAVQLTNDEKFKQKVVTGKEFLMETAGFISDTLKTVSVNVIDSVEDTLTDISDNARVRAALQKVDEAAEKVEANVKYSYNKLFGGK
ncbi:MAG: hypothetical protein HUJ53_11320 [Holdemanella sp.]|nr:hypothetical protein [Holdemanella sp.]